MAATSIRATVFPRATPAVDVVLAAGGAALIAVAAQISISLPFTPVPLTLQTFAVAATAAALGLRTGAAASILYVAAGLVGLPVYANATSGWHVLSSATGGYLIGFVVCALIVGWCGDRGWTSSFSSTVGAILLGETVIYVCGLLWLRHVLHTPLDKTLEYGLYPFVVGDLIKVYAAAAVLPPAHRLIRRLRSTI
ncbi:MAG: biotin transport system substrate-specific component [Gaiellaceae bacterium]|jgi:biotin transport system substrate-specific component|nr:biotin transport system substrate-specific component [Gaiellaceae bacterium]